MSATLGPVVPERRRVRPLHVVLIVAAALPAFVATCGVTLLAVAFVGFRLFPDTAWFEDPGRWAGSSFFMAVRVEQPFRARLAGVAGSDHAESDRAASWRDAVAEVDPTQVPTMVDQRRPTRFVLVVDEGSRIAMVHAPRTPIALLLGERATAAVWDWDLARKLDRRSEDLAWTASDPRFEWDPIDEEDRP